MKKRLLASVLALCVVAGTVLLPEKTVLASQSIEMKENVYDILSSSGKQELFPYIYETTEGFATNNVSANDYVNAKRWAAPVYSYLTQNSDGSFQRVECSEEKVHIEQYASDFSLKSAVALNMELPLFGGCFMGETYNFLVFGQMNPEESNGVEVLSIVKYSKNWERINAVSILGANTYEPFCAGSLRMTESSGMLYIHTCHEMYKSPNDGKNHQANMTFEVNMSSMEVTQQWTDVMNINYGYVSHSFNQFIVTDGSYLYRLDHGDAHPRAVVITKCPTTSITSCSGNSRNILPISGDIGDNDTGVSVGGFALANSCLVAVGNSVNQNAESWSSDGVRNIFVTSTDTGLSNTTTNWLTSYTANDTIMVGNPHLVKVGENSFYVLWEEYDKATKLTVVKIAQINSVGMQIGDIVSIYGNLSDCAPIYTSSGKLVWYTTGQKTPIHMSSDKVIWQKTGESSPTFYSLDTSKMSSYSFSGRIDLSKCNITLEKDTYEYNSNYIKPNVVIKYGEYVLEQGTDYSIKYLDNIYPGTAVITITGKGLFEGTQEKQFMIKTKDISGYTLKLEPEEIIFDNRYHSPSYEIYNGNDRVYISGDFESEKGFDVGEYAATFTANDCYSGEIKATYKIKARNISGGSVELSQNTYKYDGKKKKPEPTVIVDGIWLQKDLDYTVSYKNNVNVGTAEICIKGKGNFTGTLVKNFIITESSHEHSYTSEITKKATCTKEGVRTYTCSCGDSYTEKIAKKEHTVVKDKAVAATCTKTGKTEGSHCSKCDKVIIEQETTEKIAHDYKTTSEKKATKSKNGSINKECSGCGATTKQTIYAAKKVTLSSTSYQYNGKNRKPSVTVMDSKNKKISSKYYTVSYKNNKKAGKASVTVKLKGRYSGTFTKTFEIKPESTVISKVSAKSKGISVKWKKQNTQTSGYEIQYSTSSKFAKDKTKTVTIKSNKTTSKNISKLKAKKKYYVRIRTYKNVKVDGKTTKIYSKWSATKSITTKK